MTDLVKLARQRIDDSQRTHWEGCERDHRECLIQRMADEIERLRALLRNASESLTEIVRSPNAEHVADAHNAAVQAIRKAVLK